MRWKGSKLLIHSNLFICLFGKCPFGTAIGSSSLLYLPSVMPLAGAQDKNSFFEHCPPPYMGRNPSFCRTISIIFLNICMSSVNTVFLISSSSLVGNILVGITFSCVSLLFFNAFNQSAFLVLRNEIRRNRHLVVVRSVKFICGQQQASLLSSSCWGFTLAGMLFLLLLSWWLLVTVAVFYTAWLLQCWQTFMRRFSIIKRKAFSSVFCTQEL